jgi:magnesium transporter
MISVYLPNEGRLDHRHFADGEAIPEAAVWIDLVNPSPGEDKLIERSIGVAVPTREEMQEIEISSRLYVEHGARYMTATLMCHSDTAHPRTTPVTFILAAHRLITVRYDEPKPFAVVRQKLARACPPAVNGEHVLLDLLDTVIDRSADILERVGSEIDHVSRTIFDRRTRTTRYYDVVLDTIGRKGDLTSKVRESLVSIGRLVLFLANESEGMRWSKERRAQLKSMQRDVFSLNEHTAYLSSSITFLLDALVGVVTIEQNNVIKIFSVVAVVFLPPTLIASIYGMNYKHMPELEWTYGYPLSLLLMLLAAIGPYLYFKWRKWL